MQRDEKYRNIRERLFRIKCQMKVIGNRGDSEELLNLSLQEGQIQSELRRHLLEMKEEGYNGEYKRK